MVVFGGCDGGWRWWWCMMVVMEVVGSSGGCCVRKVVQIVSGDGDDIRWLWLSVEAVMMADDDGNGV